MNVWPKIEVPDWLPSKGRHLKLVISGSVSAGKDFVAERLGGAVYRMSDCLRALHCAADALKDRPFGRAWYQYVGSLVTHACADNHQETIAALTKDWVARLVRAAREITDKDLARIQEPERWIFSSLAWDDFGLPEFFAASAHKWYHQFVAPFSPRTLYIVTGLRREQELRFLLRHGYKWVIVVTDKAEHYKRLERQYGHDRIMILSHASEKWIQSILNTLETKGEIPAYVVWNGDNGVPKGFISVEQLKKLLING